jgi:hypothetical protein
MMWVFSSILLTLSTWAFSQDIVAINTLPDAPSARMTAYDGASTGNLPLRSLESAKRLDHANAATSETKGYGRPIICSSHPVPSAGQHSRRGIHPVGLTDGAHRPTSQAC